MSDDAFNQRSEQPVASFDDAVDEVVPAKVATVDSIEQLRDRLNWANSKQLALVFAGNRSKIGWGAPPDRLDLVVNLGKMPRFTEHAASDLVVRVSASTGLDELQAVLARSNQRLAIDSVVPGTSIGGLIATGIAGPLRYGFGSVRDLVIGITTVRADGTRASSGGRVVKNVAGYDLAKLYTGSFGTLGAITEAYFRLHALPAQSHYVLGELDLASAEQTIRTLLHSQLAMSAIEIQHNNANKKFTVGVLVEGIEKSVRARTEMVAQIIGPETVTTEDRPHWWGRLPGSTTIKMNVEIARVVATVDAVRQAAAKVAQPVIVTGSAGVGVFYVGTEVADETDNEHNSRFVRAIRATAIAAGGSAVVLRAPVGVRRSVDVWGPIPALAVMQRVKAQFDPAHILAPGRFVGGI